MEARMPILALFQNAIQACSQADAVAIGVVLVSVLAVTRLGRRSAARPARRHGVCSSSDGIALAVTFAAAFAVLVRLLFSIAGAAGRATFYAGRRF